MTKAEAIKKITWSIEWTMKELKKSKAILAKMDEDEDFSTFDVYREISGIQSTLSVCAERQEEIAHEIEDAREELNN